MNKENEKFKEAAEIVFAALRDDEAYYYAWQSNIAMGFKDVLNQNGYSFPALHELANTAAKNFLAQLIKCAD